MARAPLKWTPLGSAAIAAGLGVTPASFKSMRSRMNPPMNPPLPPPDYENVSGAPAWTLDSVERWIEKSGRAWNRAAALRAVTAPLPKPPRG